MRKNTFIKLILGGTLAFSAYADLSAQTTGTWMLDNYAYGYRINPSYIPERGYMGIAIGSLNLSLSSDLGLDNLLFPTSDGLVTGFNKNVSPEEFLSGMKELNQLNFNLNENLLGIGFRGKKGGFTTIEMNLRADVGANLPKDLFAMLKEGSNGTYDLSRTKVSASAYAEIAVGYSRALGSRLTVGARVKALAGLGNARMEILSASARSDADAISLQLDARIKAAAPYLKYGTKASEYQEGVNDVIDMESFEFDKTQLKPSGYGLAMDLGATFKPVKDLEVGISLNDIGAILWQYTIQGKTDADVIYSGEKVSIKEDSEDQVGSEMESAVDALSHLSEFREVKGKASALEMLPLNLNASVKYRMPFYRRLSVGALASYTNRIGYNSFEVRGAAAVTPVNWFSLTANAGASSYGAVSGAAMSINIASFNLWAAVDSYLGKTAHWTSDNGNFRVAYPVSSFDICASFGINKYFGKRASPFKDRQSLSKAEKKELRKSKRQ